VTFYDGYMNYIIATGKIKIDTVNTTEVTGKMYAKGSDSDNEINGTFTLSRCCLSSGSYSLCSESDTTTTTDTTAPVIAEVTAVTTPTNDKTPNYTFSSTEAGTITYGGSCSSSTTSATTDNNTITFSTLDNGTHSNCTIKVTDSSANVSNTIEITDFTVSYWQLIARQVDSDNFTDGTNELFSSNARSTFLENDNDSSSSTFMSIGNLNKSYYADNGTYKFKLVWGGMEVDNLTIKEVIWTQTSWLDNSTTQGFQEIGDSGFNTGADPNTDFVGLALSTESNCVFDGDGGTVTNRWWNCVGVASLHTYGGSTGMPGPLLKIASSMHLYVWVP